MSEHSVQAKTREMVLEAVVIRSDGTREDLGTIAYWHRNPLKRAWHRLRHGKTGTIRKV